MTMSIWLSAKPPKDFRLSDDWLRCVMKAFLLLSPGTSRKRAILRRILRWSTDDVHETTDVERVECSADLLEVKGAKMSSKSSPWITGRDTLGLSATAETSTSRGHKQVNRLESADAAQRRGTVECPKQKIEESARQVDCVYSVHTDW